ncbi:MAG: nicotinate (nicotinamide) nucleotide adenylyltransferase [Hyphomicrobiales bacterium]
MSKNKNIGLYFGSFNPIHIGHLIIANYIQQYTDLDEIWFVVSPQNPFKEKKSLLADHHRLELIRLCLENHDNIKVTDIEFKLPVPSYTIDTLVYLEDKYPSHNFVLICGADNIQSFHKWKNYKEILNNYKVYVYKRPGYTTYGELENHPSVKLFDAPQMEISASFIREGIKSGKDMSFFLHDKVLKYINEMHFYKK